MITKHQLEYWTNISPEIANILKEYQDKLRRRNLQIKDLKTQKQIGDTLHLQASEKIRELQSKIVRYEGPEVMGKCNKCSWKIER